MKLTLSTAVPVLAIVGLLAAGTAPAEASAADSPAAHPAPPSLEATTPTVDANATADAIPVMGDYRAATFAPQAARLDPGLAKAAREGLGLSAAEYLAEGAAASDASAVLDALKARDGGVIDGRMSGTDLTVYVSTPSAARLARSAGASVVFGAPPLQKLPAVRAIPAADTVRGGQPYLATATAASTYGEICSTGFNGYGLSTGASQLVTAGHCYDSTQPLLRLLNYSKPNDVPTSTPSAQIGATLGTWLPGVAQFGGGADSALLAVNSQNITADPSVLTWGGGTGAPLAGTPVGVTNTTSAVVGAPICKSGATSGWTCGKVLAVDTSAQVGDDDGVAHTVNSVVTSACVIPGDSGGAALIGTAAAGVTSWTAAGSCSSTRYQSGFSPMVSSKGSVTSRLGSAWEPAVVVNAVPAITSLPSSKRVFQGGTLSGSATGAVSGDYVKVQFSGESTARTANIVNGKWSMSLSGLSAGQHSYTARIAWGQRSLGTAVTGTLTDVAKPAATRNAGADRYATSVAISKAGYPAGAKVVYVATGLNYPDALSAGPIAAKEKAPLLLTAKTLPNAVRAEIARLAPDEIVVVGGTTAVPASVAASLAKLAPKVTRIAGSDRFDTSRKLITRAFPGTAPTVYVATGANFPDALAAGAAAGAHGAPVLLVNGSSAISGATRSFLAARHPSEVVVVGGTTVISNAFQTSLTKAGYQVSRPAGADRFATSEVVGRVSFPTFDTAYFATGYAFPDALAGSAVAGAKGAPLFTVPRTCVPAAVIGDLVNQTALTSVVVLGGTAAVTDAVGRLASC